VRTCDELIDKRAKFERDFDKQLIVLLAVSNFKENVYEAPNIENFEIRSIFLLLDKDC